MKKAVLAVFTEIGLNVKGFDPIFPSKTPFFGTYPEIPGFGGFEKLRSG
jgi:hypothetical protein